MPSSRPPAARCASRWAGGSCSTPERRRPRARACGAGCRPSSPAGARYRAYVTPLRDPGLGGLARLEVVSALAPLEHRQSQLEHRLLALGLIALVAAGAGVWLAADLVLRPLRRLRTVASSVAEDEDLDRRVPPGRRDRAALAGGELQRDAGAPRALGGRPRARPGRDAALHRRRRPRAAHAADQRPGHALDPRAPSRPPARAPCGDARRRAGRAAPARRAPGRPAGARARRRGAARVHRGRPRRGRRRRGDGGRRAPPRVAAQRRAARHARSRSRAGSPDCGCWPTTSSRTPRATAAPTGRSA